MSSNGLPQMPAPVCLIENTDKGLQTVESSLDLLRGIQQPVVVVAVVGLYRTGKSYLMNRLAGQQSGFALGSTIESKTKGIWMWCVPHPLKPGHCLLLLDTEGLGDVDKGDSKNDAWIFCLAVLLSSTLVYNSRGTIDNQAIEKLHYVTELTDQIQVKSVAASNGDDEEMPEDCQFVRFFPGFVWAVRDFTLERKIDGRDVSEDEYLDFALNLKKGLNPKVVTYNLPRQCIRNFFPTRKCFTFPFPTAASKMTNLDSMAETDLEPDFRRVADRFCAYIFAESRVKTVQGGHKVNGSRFSHLVKIYVDTINSGSVPCLENAVVAMAEIENQSAVKEGFRLYEQSMEDVRKNFPIDLGHLSVEHQRLETMATQLFLKRSFKDEGGKYMTQLQEIVGKFYEQLINENMDASERLCRKLLFDLYAPMAANIQQGTYAKAGGYEIYCRDRDAMVARYRQHGNKGMKGEEVLEEFLQEKNSEANAILMADERLSDADKQMAEAQEQARVQEQKAKAAAKRQEDLQRALEDEQRHQEERLKRMEEKMEEEKRLQREELNRAMESKLKEQQEMLEKGFKDKAEIMDQEIQQLKIERQQQQQQDKGFFKKIFMPVAKLGANEAQRVSLLEQANKAEEEKCQQLQSLYEEEKRSHQENLNRLKEKQQEECALLAAEQQRALESKLAEQQVMLQKGFQQQEQELREQIQQLRREQELREAQEARQRLEEEKQATQATMQMLGSTAEMYYNYKLKREDRRHQQLLAEKERYAYKKKKLAMSGGGGSPPGGPPKVGEVPKGAGASGGGVGGGQTEV